MSRVPVPERGGRARPLQSLASAPPPSIPPRIALAAAASELCAIAVPAVAISLYAAVVPSAAAVSRFALAVAEPTALAAAVVVTASGARWAAGGATRPRLVGLAAGVLAALVGLAAAAWVGDVDGWTGAASAIQPLAELLGGHRAAKAAAREAARRAARANGGGRRPTPAAPAAAPLASPPPVARVTTPAVAFEATLVPPSAARARQAAATRPACDPACEATTETRERSSEST